MELNENLFPVYYTLEKPYKDKMMAFGLKTDFYKARYQAINGVIYSVMTTAFPRYRTLDEEILEYRQRFENMEDSDFIESVRLNNELVY